jgi:hypothetical protein
MWAMPTLSRTMSTDPIRTYPIRTPQACYLSHQGNSTNPSYFIFLMHDYSFIHSHTRIHTFIHTVIHSYHTSEASHMQLMHHNAPRCVTKR